MTTLPRILIIEDALEIRNFLEAALSHAYQIKTAATAKDGLKLSSRQPPDAIILDLGLPDMDGKEFIAEIRKQSQLPIIVLSARHRESEKVAALEMGADDYLTKPFGTEELLARIKVALRRRSRHEVTDAEIYDIGGLRVNLILRQVQLDGSAIQLTPTEYSLLACLVRKAGQIVTQSELLREVWGNSGNNNSHYLRIYVQHLRNKLKDNPLKPKFILTDPGVGYRLVGE
jgi:two-component system KDP operon response regulator KdpE